VIEARQAFEDEQPTIDPAQVVACDQMGTQLSMQRTHALAPEGERAIDHAPVNHGENLTVMGAMTLQGVVGTMAVKGATTTAVVLAFVHQVLVKILRPGMLVLLDNLAAHHAATVREAIEAKGAKAWFLPPYSPEYNPIEKCWSKVKAFLRKARARTMDALLDALATGLGTVTSQDARNWFRHCGFAVN
jgi:transposase